MNYYKELNRVLFFFNEAIELLDQNKKYEMNVIKTFESYFGRDSLRVTIVLPELSMLLFTAKANALISLMRKYSIECVDNIYISFELKTKREYTISEYKQGYADCGCEFVIGGITQFIEHKDILTLDLQKINFVF